MAVLNFGNLTGVDTGMRCIAECNEKATCEHGYCDPHSYSTCRCAPKKDKQLIMKKNITLAEVEGWCALSYIFQTVIVWYVATGMIALSTIKVRQDAITFVWLWGTLTVAIGLISLFATFKFADILGAYYKQVFEKELEGLSK